MKLDSVDFGNVFNSSGARNFFGDGYWHSRFTNWKGSTFIARTTTVHRKQGNIEFDEKSIKPKKLIPDCIKVRFFKGAVLNAIGLSGPGAKALFDQREWDKRTDPFILSFMPVQGTKEKRLQELKSYANMLIYYSLTFNAPFALEINLSCPNVGLDPFELIVESREILDMVAFLKIPILLKINVLISSNIAYEISQHPVCSALSISNTLPWNTFSNVIDWEKIWGQKESPLVKFGGGGMSGTPIYFLVLNWLKQFRECDEDFPLKVGGGVMSKNNALELLQEGATAIELGTVCMLRPWRVQGIIQAVNRHLG